MITITEQAAGKILQSIERRGRGVGIRIGVKTTGCSGLAYTLEYFDKLDDEALYHIVATNDIAIVLDKKYEPYLKGMTIDWVRNGLNEGFDFSNPNERDRCGCGESFRV